MITHNRAVEIVQEPKLSLGNAQSVGGLSFKFVSTRIIPLMGIVYAGDLYFKVTDVEISQGEGSGGSSMVYTCNHSSTIPTDMNLSEFNYSVVTPITDPDQIERIRKDAGIC